MRRWSLVALASILPWWLVACGSEPQSLVASAKPVADEPLDTVPIDELVTGGPVAAADVQGDKEAIEACQAINAYKGTNLAAAFTSDAGTIRHWDGPGTGKMAEGQAYDVPRVIKGKPDETVAYACYIVDDKIEMPRPPGMPEVVGVIVIADTEGDSDTWLGIIKDQLVIERPTHNYERPQGDN